MGLKCVGLKSRGRMRTQALGPSRAGTGPACPRVVTLPPDRRGLLCRPRSDCHEPRVLALQVVARAGVLAARLGGHPQLPRDSAFAGWDVHSFPKPCRNLLAAPSPLKCLPGMQLPGAPKSPFLSSQHSNPGRQSPWFMTLSCLNSQPSVPRLPPPSPELVVVPSVVPLGFRKQVRTGVARGIPGETRGRFSDSQCSQAATSGPLVHEARVLAC